MKECWRTPETLTLHWHSNWIMDDMIGEYSWGEGFTKAHSYGNLPVPTEWILEYIRWVIPYDVRGMTVPFFFRTTELVIRRLAETHLARYLGMQSYKKDWLENVSFFLAEAKTSFSIIITYELSTMKLLSELKSELKSRFGETKTPISVILPY